MKITDVEAIILKQPQIELIGDGTQDTVVVKVYTDEGIVGYGEVDSSPYVVKAIIDAPASHMVCMGLKEAIIGEDPLDTERLWNKMYHMSYYYGRRGVAIHAVSGVDMALWDIKGKMLGLPVYKLIGGAFRDKVKAYCSILMPDDEGEVREIIDKYTEQGFRAFKFGWGALGKSLRDDVRLVGAARKHLGDDKDLMVDIGMVWGDAKTAIQRCEALSEFSPYWVEEPLWPDDLDGYRRLCISTDIKIAAGEEVGTLYEFKELIEGCGIDVVQPDMSRCGGLTIARKLTDINPNIPIIPHNFKSGILMAASLQFIAAMKNAEYLEFCCQETAISKNLVLVGFKVDKDGYVDIPQKPGLGIELNEEFILNYLWENK